MALTTDGSPVSYATVPNAFTVPTTLGDSYTLAGGHQYAVETPKQLRKRAKRAEKAVAKAKAQAKRERKAHKKFQREQAAAHAVLVSIATDERRKTEDRIYAARTIIYGQDG